MLVFRFNKVFSDDAARTAHFLIKTYSSFVCTIMSITDDLLRLQ